MTPHGASVPRPGFGSGASAVLAGFGTILRSPSLWPWALVPVLVLLALDVLFVVFAVKIGGPWVRSLLPAATSDWGQIGVGLVSWAAVAVLVVAGWFLAVPLAPPLSAPALEHIVARVESELGMPRRESIGFFHELVCGFRAMAGGLAVGGPILALLWSLEFFVPPVAIVTTPAKFVVSSLLVAWGLFDYPLTLRGVGFRARLALMRANFPCVLGFGLTFALVFWVPCCGVALLPVGAAAATRLITEIEKSQVAPTAGVG